MWIYPSSIIRMLWLALHFDPAMQEYYRSHQGKDVKRILVKVARKLLSLVHAIIRTETPYEIGVVSSKRKYHIFMT
ncbi:hypothetical protein ACWGOQ_0016580 [Aquimarina sp. M1]